MKKKDFFGEAHNHIQVYVFTKFVGPQEYHLSFTTT